MVVSLRGPDCPRLPHNSNIANIMKQDQMTTLIKIKQIQRLRIISLQSSVHSKLVVPDYSVKIAILYPLLPLLNLCFCSTVSIAPVGVANVASPRRRGPADKICHGPAQP